MASLFQLPQPVNALQAIGYGRDLRAQQDQRKNQNALRDLMQTSDISTSAGRESLAQGAFKIDPEQGLRFMETFDRMDERTRQRAMALKQDAARIALQLKDAPPERKGALWTQAASMYPEVYSGVYQPGAEDRIISEAQTFDQLLAERQKREDELRKPGQTREVTRGGMTVTEEWNPETRTWTEIGRGSRFAPQQPTEMQTWEAWLKSDDPQKRAAAEAHFKIGGGAGAGTFEGTGMDAQSWNIILGGRTDTPEYAAAYNHLFEQPKMVQTERGMVPVMPAVPPTVKKPGVAASAPAESGTGQPQAGAPIPGTAKPATEAQLASAGFASRMEAAEPLLQQFESEASSGWENFLSRMPGGNYLNSAEYQQVQQAFADWVRAKLRKESGAVIGEGEMADEIKLYLPQPGDGPEVIAQKRKARATAFDAMRNQAAHAYKPKPGEILPGEPTAYNQATGQTIVLRNGKWVDPTTGEEVR